MLLSRIMATLSPTKGWTRVLQAGIHPLFLAAYLPIVAAG